MAEIERGDTVEVVMLKGLLDTINMLIEPHGWVLMRAPFLDADEEDTLPTFLATIVPGSAAEQRLLDKREGSSI